MAFGFEYHMEEFEQKVGKAQSWFIDENLRNQGFTIGSNGFAGYPPQSAGVFERNNYALYLDLEAEVIPSLSLGLAGRYENFDSAIGESLNGKGSVRWQLLDALALRGSVGSGFRAPTPGQAKHTENQLAVYHRRPGRPGHFPLASPGLGLLRRQAAGVGKNRSTIPSAACWARVTSV